MKILILAYEFPPLISVGGQRPFYWGKYWSENDVKVTVVTRYWDETVNTPEDYVKPTPKGKLIEVHNDNYTVVRATFFPNFRDRILLKYGFYGVPLLRKFLSFLYGYLEWFFYFFDAKSVIFYAAEEQLKNGHFDMIIATGQPFILFKYASELSRKFRVPWVADYRDAWTTDQGDSKTKGVQKLQHAFLRKMEVKTVSSALFISTAAPPYKRGLEKLFPDKFIAVSYNGFDDSILNSVENIPVRRDKFCISYIGMLHSHQKLETFLQAIKEILAEGVIKSSEMEITFYATNAFPDSKRRVMDFDSNVSEVIVTTDRIPYKLLMCKISESHLLLLLSKKNANWLNTKIFDYFAVNRPVLLVENDEGILNDLITETSCGYVANEVNDVKRIILSEFDRFKNGKLSQSSIHPKCLSFTRRRQAIDFQKIIHERLIQSGE